MLWKHILKTNKYDGHIYHPRGV